MTGAAGGIGGDLSRALAGRGAKVAVTDTDEAGIAKIAAELSTFGTVMDVAKERSVREVVSRVCGELGPLDMLFNVAGIIEGHFPLQDMPMETFDLVFSVNMRGMLVTTQAVARSMIAEGRKGVITNVGSNAGLNVGADRFAYGISKMGVHALTRAAAKGFAPYGIRVNAVAPGPVYTPMSRAVMDDPEGRAAWEARIPLHRIADTNDVVDVMLFLASDRAKNMTGAIVSTDGGSSA
ncbi:MAG: SDR family NAD(P)-dependent oxidoreductase [Acidimicrobiales bacterium]